MKVLFILLAVINVLMFGLGQGWFGSTRTESGRQPAFLQTQLNGDALAISRASLLSR
jgi:hypothetical protein